MCVLGVCEFLLGVGVGRFRRFLTSPKRPSSLISDSQRETSTNFGLVSSAQKNCRASMLPPQRLRCVCVRGVGRRVRVAGFSHFNLFSHLLDLRTLQVQERRDKEEERSVLEARGK